ncbi:MAG: FAD-dependent monooxygenase [Quisquiliibacterium sp.]
MQTTYHYPSYPYRRAAELDDPQQRRVPVLIVGAGPVGLSAAIDLAMRDIPVVLVDRGDEVYRRERIPPLRGASRRALLTRRARQMGSEPFYQLTLGCGREAGGRGDEWVLFCAVPAGEWLTDWLDLALGQRVPVRCLSSLPALMPALWRLAADRMPGEHVLMVSWHPASGLRQSVLTRGRLQFCRCVPLSWSARIRVPA